MLFARAGSSSWMNRPLVENMTTELETANSGKESAHSCEKRRHSTSQEAGCEKQTSFWRGVANRLPTVDHRLLIFGVGNACE